MAYTTKTTTSYGTRVSNSFKQIKLSFSLFVAGTVLLWWNEGRTVKTNDMLIEAQQVCVKMEHTDRVDPSFDGKLVCANAAVSTTDSVSDPVFGIGATAVGVRRKVEYYQWTLHSTEKTTNKVGGKQETETVYDYKAKWCASPVNSIDFADPDMRYSNFALLDVDNESFWAQNVAFGAYQLPEALIHKVSHWSPMTVSLDDQMVKQLNQQAISTYGKHVNDLPLQQRISRRLLDPNDPQLVHADNYTLYIGQSPEQPRVGDIRVTFEKNTPTTVTVLAKVQGDTFTKYVAKNGYTLQTLSNDIKGMDEMFEGEHRMNSFMLWLLRLAGIAMVIGALKGMVGFLEVLLMVVPFLASIFGWGVKVICTVVGVAWSLIVIGVAWLFYRPATALILLAVAGVLVALLVYFGRFRKKTT